MQPRAQVSVVNVVQVATPVQAPVAVANVERAAILTQVLAAVVPVRQILSQQREQAAVRRVPVDMERVIIEQPVQANVRNVVPINIGTDQAVQIVTQVVTISPQRVLMNVRRVMARVNTGLGLAVRHVQMVVMPIVRIRAVTHVLRAITVKTV